MLASIFADNGKDCVTYWKAAGALTGKANTICTGYDFTDPNSLYGFINETWYSWSENEATTFIGCTSNQYSKFYDYSNVDSFAY